MQGLPFFFDFRNLLGLILKRVFHLHDPKWLKNPVTNFSFSWLDCWWLSVWWTWLVWRVSWCNCAFDVFPASSPLRKNKVFNRKTHLPRSQAVYSFPSLVSFPILVASYAHSDSFSPFLPFDALLTPKKAGPVFQRFKSSERVRSFALCTIELAHH